MTQSVNTPAEFAELFDRHAATIHRYVARRVGRHVADDVVATTFLVAFERRASYDAARPDARPWLYGIASNLLGRHRRDEARMLRAYARTGHDPVADDGVDQVLDRVEAEASKRRLAAALAGLPTGDRDVVLLFAWASFSYNEIALALDVPPGTVRSRLHRARRSLRTALGGEHPDLIEETHHG